MLNYDCGESTMFGRKKPEEPIIEEKPVITSEQADVKEIKYTASKVTVIGEGVSMVGDFVTNDPIELKGTLRGSVISDTSLHIAKTGKMNGDAKISDISVDGVVDGTLVVEGLASISNTGVMKGSLQTARFASEPGSIFDGTFTMSTPKKKPEPNTGL